MKECKNIANIGICHVFSASGIKQKNNKKLGQVLVQTEAKGREQFVTSRFPHN